MDISRLFDGIALLLVIVLAVHLLGQIDGWRSAVSALQLRWEREQRQAAPNGVSLGQRQDAQAEFEQLVANRPMRLWWMHLAVAVGIIGFVVVLGWRLDDLRWVGLWLALPLGLAGVAIHAYGWSLVNQANTRLTAISTTLYGPAPPRVKIRSIQTAESDISSS